MLERSILNTIIDSLEQGNLLIGSIVLLVLSIGCLLAFKLRFPIPKKIFFTATILAVTIPFIIPYPISRFVVLIASVVIIIGDIILFANLPRKLSISHEKILNTTQVAAVLYFLWAMLSLIAISANLTIALASGMNSIPAELIKKIEDKERVLLIFSVSQNSSPSGFMDVWLPTSNSQNFTKNYCYQLSYFKSPFLKVEGRSDVYVTSIQNQNCK